MKIKILSAKSQIKAADGVKWNVTTTLYFLFNLKPFNGTKYIRFYVEDSIELDNSSIYPQYFTGWQR